MDSGPVQLLFAFLRGRQTTPKKSKGSSPCRTPKILGKEREYAPKKQGKAENKGNMEIEKSKDWRVRVLFTNFRRKRPFALFCGLLRSFADLRLRCFAHISALLRTFACFCERLRLERLRFPDLPFLGVLIFLGLFEPRKFLGVLSVCSCFLLGFSRVYWGRGGKNPCFGWVFLGFYLNTKEWKIRVGNSRVFRVVRKFPPIFFWKGQFWDEFWGPSFSCCGPEARNRLLPSR